MLHRLNTNISFLNPEVEKNDAVFNTKDYKNAYNSDLVPATVYDKDYLSPDRQQYMFSTMGTGINALMPNNMLIPVRNKYRLGHYTLSLELSKIDKTLNTGIFIVEYYTIHNNTSTDMTGIIKYYLTTKNIEYNEATVNDIITIISGKNGDLEPLKYTFRIITFVPQEQIKQYGYVYVPDCGVVLVDGIPDEHIAYPTSKSYMDGFDTEMENNKNTVFIEIVDNKSNKPYFIKIGNDVKRIFPTRNIEDAEQCKFTFKRNKRTVEEINVPLEDMGNKLGIYHSEKEARTNGNPEVELAILKNSIDEKKIALEENKIVAEYRKMLIEMNNLLYKSQLEVILGGQKLKASELDVMKRNIDIEMTYRKGLIDIKLMLLKSNIETRHLTLKNKYAAGKDVLDNISKVLSIATSAYKLFQ